jgi:glutathione peroxidase
MTLHDFKTKTLTGKPYDFSQLKGKKVMVVNTASKCGLTPQYKDLEQLYKEYNNEGLEIIAFPCNDFGAQEPGSPEEITEFCSTNYGVSFPMMEKVSVKGDDMHPIYKWLLAESSKQNDLDHVKWNFQKFLVDEDGKLIQTIEPTTPPLDKKIIDWING